MNIKPTDVKKNLLNKQRVPRSLLDAAVQLSHPTASVPAKFKQRPQYARGQDMNVNAPRIGSEQAFFPTTT